MPVSPLLTEPLYDALRARRKLVPGNPAYAFLPVSDLHSSLLFVGQATAGWFYQDDLDFRAAASESCAIMRDFLASGRRSAFWRTVSEIRRQVSRVAVGSNDIGQLSVGWSNLCKIGCADGNPSREMIEAQADICIEALHHELRAAGSQVTIFLTDRFARREIFEPVVGRHGWRNNVRDEDRIAVKQHPDFGCLIWSYHPRSKHGLLHRQELTAFISGFASARLFR
jgi:hypothetical protein